MKKLGFGFMRLPMKDGEVDYAQTCRMTDRFIEEGFTYFDTAHGYVGEKSELAIKKCLTERYDRDAYLLADKLSNEYFSRGEEIVPFFEKQLEACGVEYFDYYLYHAINARYYEKYTDCRAFETVARLHEQGRVKHIGMSFHDKAPVLDMILNEHPEIEVVQIQFNYNDYEDPGVQSRLCYEVCRKHGVGVIVMEPVRGGTLVNLPPEAGRILDELNSGSRASYAIRFAASFDGILTVLSGMSNIEQLEDNISYMKDFRPLSPVEREAVSRVCAELKKKELIQCTSCRYCTSGCPAGINIPELFACMNAKKTYCDWNSDMYYEVNTQNSARAGDCIGCGRCEDECPQKLPIRELLAQTSAVFDK